jgi:DNA mismatch repair protein MSH3
MAPAKSSPLPSSSQNKKQQSISSFFAPKGSATPKPSKSVPIVHPSNDSVDEEGEGDEVPRRPTPNHSKRTIDDANSDEENQEPSPKRVRHALLNATITASSLLAADERQKHNDTSRAGAGIEITNLSKVSTRTSRYNFSSSPLPEDEDKGSEESIRRKEALHKRFVQKLGAPDSLTEIKRRRWNNTEGEGVGENGEDDEEEEPAPKSVKGKKGGARANGKLTPMELQFLEIKRKHMDTIIAYQVGYKYKFFGEDARIAAKELGIFCVPGKFRFDEREYH